VELQVIQKRIYQIRGQKIRLDFDLAELYEVETRILNQAVKRKIDLFPKDFMFRLERPELEDMSSQIVMTYPRKRPKSSLPLAFTEHGVIMLANVLRSKKAKLTSVAIVRAFVALKQYTANYKKLAGKLEELEKHYNKQFQDIYHAINYLIQKRKPEDLHKYRRQIGFK